MTEPTNAPGVASLALYGDPTLPPEIVEIHCDVRFDGDAWYATSDDPALSTVGYRTRPEALRAIMLEHLRLNDSPTRRRTPGEETER